MKIAKRATQKNVVLNRDQYLEREIDRMLRQERICWFDGNKQSCSMDYTDDTQFRIFTENLTEIKIILEDGYYETVAIGKDGEKYYVEI